MCSIACFWSSLLGFEVWLAFLSFGCCLDFEVVVDFEEVFDVVVVFVIGELVHWIFGSHYWEFGVLWIGLG